MIKKLAEILGVHPFLTDFSPEQVEFMAGCASNRVFKEGEFLIREGMAAREFYLIKQGRVAIEIFQPHGEPRILQTIHRGEIVGWSWIVEPYRYAFDARATRLTRTIAFDAECLRDKFDEDAKLGYLMLRQFTKVISERLSNTWLQLMDVYAQDGTDD